MFVSPRFSQNYLLFYLLFSALQLSLTNSHYDFTCGCDGILALPINFEDWDDTAVGWLGDEGINVDDDVLKEVLNTNTGIIRNFKLAIEDIIC